MTTAATINKAELMPPPVAETMQTRSMFIGLVGAAGCVAGAFIAPESFYSAYLTVFMVGLSLSLGCLSILMLYHLVGGAWGTVSRRTLCGHDDAAADGRALYPDCAESAAPL
jgi:hypothetical protein